MYVCMCGCVRVVYTCVGVYTCVCGRALALPYISYKVKERDGHKHARAGAAADHNVSTGNVRDGRPSSPTPGRPKP